jgi:hypothetical protein
MGGTQFFQDLVVPKGARLAGCAALVDTLKLKVPIRSASVVSESHIRGSQRSENGWTIFDKRYWPGDTITDQLMFALRHEPIDLLLMKRAFDVMSADELKAAIESAPTGANTRRMWFFYETLTKRQLDLSDGRSVTAVDALDPKAYFTGTPKLSKRHRVRDNLLGSGSYCPMIRRTDAIADYTSRGLDQKAADIIGRTGRHLIARAASFLMLADSRASFEIEGERPPRNRLERWGRAVQQAGKNPLSIAELNRLHNVLIEDNRFIKAGLRDDGVFLGEHDHNGDPLPDFIGARPDDVGELLEGMLAANDRMRESELEPVLKAAATAFGFVYIHPYQDGNGRLHRCLIHHVLAESGFSPPGMVFPVSSVMLDRIDRYREVLEEHSRPLMPFIEWVTTPEQNVEVTNDTADLYRYFDCTAEAEFLFACVAHTVDHDLPNEIDLLGRRDEAQRRIAEVVEMPDRLVQNLINMIRDNGGKLPKRRREKEFEALTDGEVSRIEGICVECFR